MSKIFGQNVDFNKNESLNFRFGNLLGFPSLDPADSGFAFFHTGNSKFYGWDGSDWLDFSAGGGGGDGDDLGDHILTQDLDINGFKLINSPAGFLKMEGPVDVNGQLNSDTFICSGSISGSGLLIQGSTGVLYSGSITKTGNEFGGARKLGISSDHRLVLGKQESPFAALINFDGHTAVRTHTLPNKSGTIAHLDDIGYFDTQLVTESRTGVFTDEVMYSLVIPAGFLFEDGISIRMNIAGHYISLGGSSALYFLLGGTNQIITNTSNAGSTQYVSEIIIVRTGLGSWKASLSTRQRVASFSGTVTNFDTTDETIELQLIQTGGTSAHNLNFVLANRS